MTVLLGWRVSGEDAEKRASGGLDLLLVDDAPCCYDTAYDAASAETARHKDGLHDMTAEGEHGGEGAGGDVGCEEGAAADVLVYCVTGVRATGCVGKLAETYSEFQISTTQSCSP